MTVSIQAPTPAAPDLRTAMDELHRSGHRLSAPRRRVLEALHEAPWPVTAEEIAGGLGGRLPSSDEASVYRALELLERLGLARHVHLGHGPGRYAPAAAERDYLVCERCHEVRAADPRVLAPVRDAIARSFGWQVRFTHFPLAGLCPRCARDAGC